MAFLICKVKVGQKNYLPSAFLPPVTDAKYLVIWNVWFYFLTQNNVTFKLHAILVVFCCGGSCTLDYIYNNMRIVMFLDGDFFLKDKKEKSPYILYFSYLSNMTELPKHLHCRFTYSVYLISKAIQLDFKNEESNK